MFLRTRLLFLMFLLSTALFGQTNELTVAVSTLDCDKPVADKVVGDSVKSTTLFSPEKQLKQVTINSKNTLTEQAINVDWQTNPARTSQHLLRAVPGLFVAQHAGGGKAEQIFLRGFDVDHGTDVAISVDGVPVNQVSHAHGQGYTDLHFVIPELVDNIAFNKGPYNTKAGNFSTAGSIRFKLKERLDKNQISLGYGMFNSKKAFAAFNLLSQKNHSIYLAGAFNGSDGYFDATQNFNRFNAHLSYSGRIAPRTKLLFTTNSFRSKWDASGQIPLRVVGPEKMSRFGAIDNTEGGNTGRTTVNLRLTHFLNSNTSVKLKAYHVIADFELYSNFTFFLRDSINGDQIRQKEKRNTSGLNLEFNKKHKSDNWLFNWSSGFGFRHDNVQDLELSYTKNRTETLANIQMGDVLETNYFAYSNLNTHVKKWTIDLGFRAELIDHSYADQLDASTKIRRVLLPAILPKISVFYKWAQNFQTYVKWGVGYHSNDSRFVLNQSALATLPLALSKDLGFEWKPAEKIIINMAAWHMTSQQEFIYVGDEGVVETSGASVRKGLDLFLAVQPCNAILINSSINYSHSRSKNDPQSYIPLAAPLTATLSVQYFAKNGFNVKWAARFMGNRPANTTSTIVAEGYAINDLVLGYKKGAFALKCSVGNIFNADWNETQFLTESRLKNEIEPVEEIHFTPGSPFNLNMEITYTF